MDVPCLAEEPHFKVVFGFDRLFEITKEGRFWSAKYQCWVIVRVGYRFNLASVYFPGGAWLFANRANLAAIFHDHLVDHLAWLGFTRSEADAVFLEIATVTKEPAWVRYGMYAGTRIGTLTAWLKSLVRDDEFPLDPSPGA